MDGLFEKIYHGVIYNEKDVAEMNKAIERRNEELSLKYKKILDEQGREELIELMDDTAISAGKEGFYLGMRYAFKALLALMEA